MKENKTGNTRRFKKVLITIIIISICMIKKDSKLIIIINLIIKIKINKKNKNKS